MPDLNGVLGQEEKNKVAHWIANKKLMGIDCPLCYSKNWSIADHVVSPPVVNGVGISLGIYPYPQAMVVSECGYTIYLNLVAVGIYPKG